MKVLKGFGVAILSLLLFLSLSVFGLAFTIHGTLLNPDFVAAEVDRIDSVALAREIMEEQMQQQPLESDLFMEEAISGVIADQEAYLKGQAKAVIYQVYDFLLGKKDNLSVTIPLEPLKASLKERMWQTTIGYLTQHPARIPEDLLKPYLVEHYRELISLLPVEQLPPELTALTPDLFKVYLNLYYDEFVALLSQIHLTPPLTSQLQDQLKPYFDEYYQLFEKDIPDKVDETDLPAEVLDNILLARQYVGYFQTGYIALIGFMVLLVLLIILINRSVRGATRALGTDLLIYGALEFAGVYLVKNLVPINEMLSGLSPSLQAWLVRLPGDILAPLQTFSLGVLIAGVILLVVSFVYKRSPAED
jgi:hypothetical protein